MPEEVKPEEVVKINDVECRTFKEMILYKMDRTLAIVGIIFLGSLSIGVEKIVSEAVPLINTAIGALAVYIGGRVKS